MTDQGDRKSILEFAGTWKGDDADEVLSQIMKERDRLDARRIEV